MPSADAQIIFSDDFPGKLESGWIWLREHPGRWRFQDDGLEIMVEPGLADTVRNALLRHAPNRNEGTFAIEVTVSNRTQPTQQYEQAGITWYIGGKPVLKAVKELIDGELYIFPGKRPMSMQRVRLRLVVTADGWEAQYRPEGEADYQTADSGALPPPDEDQVSIQCYNGPDGDEHWIRFEDFCIKRLS